MNIRWISSSTTAMNTKLFLLFWPSTQDKKAAASKERKRIVEHEKCLHAKFMTANLYTHNGKTNFRGIIFLLCNGTRAEGGREGEVKGGNAV